MKVVCLQCGHRFQFTGASLDEIGWHTLCPSCNGSFDIDIEEYLVPEGTKVKMIEGGIGIVDGNDSETCDVDDVFDNINYYICPIEYIHEDVWSNYYIMLQREDFEIIN